MYAYGVIAPSTLVELEGDFPEVAGYGEIAQVHPSIGGEAAAGSFVLARLGVAVKLSGSRLGRDPASRDAIENLREVGIDTSAVATDAAEPVTEIVFSAAGDRTVFGTYGRMLVEQSWSWPSRDDVTSSRIVCLDPFFGKASEQVARWSLESGVPYVTVDVPPDSPIARGATAVIVSEEYTSRTMQGADPGSVVAAYLLRCEGLVVLTQGRGPGLYGRAGGLVERVDALPVDVRDTTGAGDSFRAGVIFGILRGFDDARYRASPGIPRLAGL